LGKNGKKLEINLKIGKKLLQIIYGTIIAYKNLGLTANS
jgi:hypothetical protein